MSHHPRPRRPGRRRPRRAAPLRAGQRPARRPAPSHLAGVPHLYEGDRALARGGVRLCEAAPAIPRRERDGRAVRLVARGVRGRGPVCLRRDDAGASVWGWVLGARGSVGGARAGPIVARRDDGASRDDGGPRRQVPSMPSGAKSWRHGSRMLYERGRFDLPPVSDGPGPTWFRCRRAHCSSTSTARGVLSPTLISGSTPTSSSSAHTPPARAPATLVWRAPAAEPVSGRGRARAGGAPLGAPPAHSRRCDHGMVTSTGTLQSDCIPKRTAANRTQILVPVANPDSLRDFPRPGSSVHVGLVPSGSSAICAAKLPR